MKIKIALTICLLTIQASSLLAQKQVPANWFNLDAKKNKVPGVSTERAYNELLKNKTSKTIIVAVIDGGTDNKHEDLKNNIWTNGKEIEGNGIDDDNNGYIDDSHGWNFIGGANDDVKEDNLEITRIYANLTLKYANGDDGSDEFKVYLGIKKDFEVRLLKAKSEITNNQNIIDGIDKIIKPFNNQNPTKEQLKSYQPEGQSDEIAKQILLKISGGKMSATDLKNILNIAMEHYTQQVKYHLNTNLNTRAIVGDDYNNTAEKIYGNNNYKGPEANHGTHVAGIIAASRNNNIGMNGVSDNVRIMILRVVPNGDERDKDVANAIRYAADNGANIINMSFGKSFSPQKKVVDEAVKYASIKNVLLVHAAGNDNNSIDIENNFPNKTFDATATQAPNWIEVGASSWTKGKHIVGDFSNYGKQNVDVFAPGVDIYSTLPDNTYGSYDGTSMAAPVTAGVAALLWSYYPYLTAVEVKDIILNSAVKVKGKVIVPGEKKKKVKMAELCKTGAIVNAFQAIKYAEKFAKNK